MVTAVKKTNLDVSADKLMCNSSKKKGKSYLTLKTAAFFRSPMLVRSTYIKMFNYFVSLRMSTVPPEYYILMSLRESGATILY